MHANKIVQGIRMEHDSIVVNVLKRVFSVTKDFLTLYSNQKISHLIYSARACKEHRQNQRTQSKKNWLN